MNSVGPNWSSDWFVRAPGPLPNLDFPGKDGVGISWTGAAVGGYPEPDAKNFGNDQYGIHSKRFNYLFHGNHLQTLKIEQTVGTVTLNNPKGNWTVAAGD